MPDKPDLDGFLMGHDIFDLAGGVGFATSAPPRVPGTSNITEDDTPPPPDPGLANVLWDPAAENLFAWDPFAVDPNTGAVDTDALTQISPFDGSAYYDATSQTLSYWDAASSSFIPVDIGSLGLPDWFVLSPNPDDTGIPDKSMEVVSPGGLLGVHFAGAGPDSLALLLEGLPTVDPGGGLVWLSAS